MTIDRDTQFSDLNSNSSFYDWFTKENQEIIAKLNQINTFTVEGVNGITAPININGKASIGLSGKVDIGISFNGPAYFNGFAVIPNIAIKVPQITSLSGGFTFGTPVRVYYDIDTSSVTYGAAMGDDPDKAEVMGIISEITATHSYVTMMGKIDGDFTTVNTRGIGLTAGWIYFLDPSTAGKITDVEPIASGHVSKPVLMGLTGNSGMVLQMRGNYLNPTFDSPGVTGSNLIVLVADADLRPVVTVGTFVSVYIGSSFTIADVFTDNGVPSAKILSTTIGSGISALNSYLVPSITTESIDYYKSFEDPDGPYFSKQNSNHILGMVEAISTDGTYFYYTILREGFTKTIPPSNIGGFRGDVIYLSYQYNPSLPHSTAFPIPNLQAVHEISDTGPNTMLGIKYGSNFLVSIKYKPDTGSNTLTLQSSSSSSSSNENYLINGNFNVWQRDTIGRESSYGSTGSTPFADMWRRRDGISGGNTTKSYYLIRKELDEYQTEIEGNPQYYLDIKALGLCAFGISGASAGHTFSDHLTVGHVVPGAKFFDGNSLKIKFYGKCSFSGYPLDLYLSRYSGNQLLDYTNLGSVYMTNSWEAYTLSYLVPQLENDGINIDLDNDYSEIGVDLIRSIELANINGITLGQDLFFSLASFSASIGSGDAVSVYPEYGEQLRHCQQYYYSTYNKTQIVGSASLLDETTPTQNTESVYIQPNKSCRLLKWPVSMRTTPSVVIYSAYSGTQGAAYNKSASSPGVLLDTYQTSGTIGYDNAIRNGNNANIQTTPTVYGVNICVNNGVTTYDEVYFHIIANADFTL